MIDNFQQIRELLEFESDDEFYLAQIIQRKKENKVGGTKNHNRLLRYHAITSKEKLDNLKDEMIQFADFFNARVCINLNKRSFEKVAFKALNKLSDAISEKDFQRTRYAWTTAAGKYGIIGKKRWIIDIDEEDIKIKDRIIELVNNPGAVLERSQPLLAPLYHYLKPSNDNKIISDVPSKNGYHLISIPFDVHNFKLFYPNIEIHKNNPTNLYIP